MTNAIKEAMEQLKRQTSLTTAMTNAIKEWTKENGKITLDDLAYIVESYAFHIPKEKRIALMFNIMVRASMSK